VSNESEITLLSMQSGIMREQTQRLHRLEAQLIPLREVARLADLVWRAAEKAEMGEEHFYRVSPRIMELLAHSLHAVGPTPTAPAAEEKEGCAKCGLPHGHHIELCEGGE
jgi:hypothetical protein